MSSLVYVNECAQKFPSPYGEEVLKVDPVQPFANLSRGNQVSVPLRGRGFESRVTIRDARAAASGFRPLTGKRF